MSLEQACEELRKSCYNTIDNFINWLKSVNQMYKDEDSKTKDLLAESNKAAMVEIDKFLEVVQQMALKNDQLIDAMIDMIASDEGPKIMAAFEATAKTCEETMKKNK